jgi:hypothetical protein
MSNPEDGHNQIPPQADEQEPLLDLGVELYRRLAVDPGLVRSISGWGLGESMTRFGLDRMRLVTDIEPRWKTANSPGAILNVNPIWARERPRFRLPRVGLRSAAAKESSLPPARYVTAHSLDAPIPEAIPAPGAHDSGSVSSRLETGKDASAPVRAQSTGIVQRTSLPSTGTTSIAQPLLRHVTTAKMPTRNINPAMSIEAAPREKPEQRPVTEQPYIADPPIAKDAKLAQDAPLAGSPAESRNQSPMSSAVSTAPPHAAEPPSVQRANLPSTRTGYMAQQSLRQVARAKIPTGNINPAKSIEAVSLEEHEPRLVAEQTYLANPPIVKAAMLAHDAPPVPSPAESRNRSPLASDRSGSLPHAAKPPSLQQARLSHVAEERSDRPDVSLPGSAHASGRESPPTFLQRPIVSRIARQNANVRGKTAPPMSTAVQRQPSAPVPNAEIHRQHNVPVANPPALATTQDGSGAGGSPEDAPRAAEQIVASAQSRPAPSEASDPAASQPMHVALRRDSPGVPGTSERSGKTTVVQLGNKSVHASEETEGSGTMGAHGLPPGAPTETFANSGSPALAVPASSQSKIVMRKPAEHSIAQLAESRQLPESLAPGPLVNTAAVHATGPAAPNSPVASPSETGQHRPEQPHSRTYAGPLTQQEPVVAAGDEFRTQHPVQRSFAHFELTHAAAPAVLRSPALGSRRRGPSDPAKEIPEGLVPTTQSAPATRDSGRSQVASSVAVVSRPPGPVLPTAVAANTPVAPSVVPIHHRKGAHQVDGSGEERSHSQTEPNARSSSQAQVSAGSPPYHNVTQPDINTAIANLTAAERRATEPDGHGGLYTAPSPMAFSGSSNTGRTHAQLQRAAAGPLPVTQKHSGEVVAVSAKTLTAPHSPAITIHRSPTASAANGAGVFTGRNSVPGRATNQVEFAGMQEQAGESSARRAPLAADARLSTSFPSRGAFIQRSPLPNATASLPSGASFARSIATQSPAGAEPALNVNQLANQVYEMLVKRLASERQRRGA